MMDRVRFEAIVSAYGGEPRRWPEAERAAAQAYADSHASEFEALLREARALDDVLDADAPVAASDLLIARVIAKAPRAVRALFEPRGWAALAACAAIGVLVGFGGGALAPAQDESETMIAAAFQGSSPDIEAFEVEG
jgi:hypothetical protein